MQINSNSLAEFAKRLTIERKQQGLSRSQAAAVCNVSESFIRDAESDPGQCTLALLVRLIDGLGIRLTATGWQDIPAPAEPDAP